MGLVHLHRHSDFSLLDGVGTAAHYAKRAAELGQDALALTDHGSLAGALYHVEACNEVGVKPIVGMEAYFRRDIEQDRIAKSANNYFHLILLAKNQEGFKNLMRLSSLSYAEDNFYMKPCIDWNLLRQYSEGIIGSSSCISGIIPKRYREGDSEGAETLLRTFLDVFGDDFYLETQPHDIPEQRAVNLELLNLAQRTGVPVVATGDVHYPLKGWEDTQEISIKMTSPDWEYGTIDTAWLMSEEEIKETFYKNHKEIPHEYVQEMVANSQFFADRCDDFNYDKSPKIPRATKNVGEAESILREWCEEGLTRIGKVGDEVYRGRLEHEFEVMRKLGVLDYFVIVGDMVRWAKDQGIRVGAGRGSAAGSLVNYLIGITAIDPIGYDLLFERFLNEYRTELPDIDIDFQDNRREEVKQYLAEKWGEDHVVNIAAFQSFGLRGVIQDVSRVLKIPYAKVLEVTNHIPEKNFGMGLDDIENNVPEVRAFFNAFPEVKKHSMRLYGQMKGQSKHAAGVIITDKPAADLIPMMRDKEGGMITQWTERANAQLISPYGFLKIDCLSTDGLTVQQNAIELIKERTGKLINFEDPKEFPFIESPLNVDKEIIDEFSKGHNLGIFQFESKGIVGLLKAISPENLEHVIAANALYRPGTLENEIAYDYARRKNNQQRWEIPHPDVKKYIGGTYGFMIYQEQVMQIYNALAKDATPSESATFLKVVAKGIARDLEGKRKLQQYYTSFEEGCLEKGITKDVCDKIWGQILQMTTYAFNKSHAAGYAAQAYQDMYLKIKFPLEFYASLLSVEDKKIPKIIKEAKLRGINILPPDINVSDVGFTIDGGSIRFGLLGIKNVGPSAIEEIKKHRPFNSYDELIDKCLKSKINKKVKIALLNAGALDSLGGRKQWVLSEEDASQVAGGYTDAQKTKMEKEVTGYAISIGDGIERHMETVSRMVDDPEKWLEDDEVEVCVGGEITDVREVSTKRGERMAFVSLAYKEYEFNLTLFPGIYQTYSHMLGEGNTILVIGNWDLQRQCIVGKNICTAEQLETEMKNAGRR